jgi:abhydrolase domain-containing protein 6
MNWYLSLLLTIVIAFAAAYLLRPMWLVAAIIGSIRVWGRMRAKTIEVDGIVWPYLEGGPAGAETIVMVHGYGGDKDNWPLYARHFTKQFRVIAPDLPGFGRNVRDAALHYGVNTQTERLHAFLAALGVDRFHLAGNSMGGFIALNYALTYPEQLKSLTVFDPAGVRSINKSEVELAADEGRNLLLATTLEEFDRLLGFVMHKRLPSPKFMMKAMLAIQLRHHDLLEAIFWTLKSEALDDSLTERLCDIGTPTLIVWGRRDRVLDVSCAEVMAETMPDNRVVIFEDVGHVPMIECPRESAAHHLSLIEDVAKH